MNKNIRNNLYKILLIIIFNIILSWTYMYSPVIPFSIFYFVLYFFIMLIMFNIGLTTCYILLKYKKFKYNINTTLITSMFLVLFIFELIRKAGFFLLNLLKTNLIISALILIILSIILIKFTYKEDWKKASINGMIFGIIIFLIWEIFISLSNKLLSILVLSL